MAERLTAQGAERVHVVDNWCDDEMIRPRPREGHPLRKRNGWDDKFVVMYAGNIGLAHEFDTILDAAAELADRNGVVFVFVGGGARGTEVRRGAEGRGLARLEMHPWVSRERLPDLLTAGDVHLISLRDGLEGMLVPSKIYGVLAAGRPTLYVGPAQSEVGRILTGANCGAVVPVGDSAGLADWIRRYADTPSLWEEHGRAARRTLERDYPRKRALEKLIDLVENRASF
jgi:glycosyltransferase involved in cell wall biosynthesis